MLDIDRIIINRVHLFISDYGHSIACLVQPLRQAGGKMINKTSLGPIFIRNQSNYPHWEISLNCVSIHSGKWEDWAGKASLIHKTTFRLRTWEWEVFQKLCVYIQVQGQSNLSTWKKHWHKSSLANLKTPKTKVTEA